MVISHTITLKLPENIYLRLRQAALATKQSLDDIVLRAVEMGSPPDCGDVPAEYLADLRGLDGLDDKALWQIVRSVRQEADFVRYDDLLEKNRDGTISDEERRRLSELRTEADRFMLRKAHAASLLRWRGHQMTPFR